MRLQCILVVAAAADGCCRMPLTLCPPHRIAYWMSLSIITAMRASPMLMLMWLRAVLVVLVVLVALLLL